MGLLSDVLVAVYWPDDDGRRELAARRSVRLLRPYVIVCSAPDGRTLYGLAERPARYWTRWGALRVVRRLERRHAAVNEMWDRSLFGFRVAYRPSNVPPRCDLRKYYGQG